MTRQTKEEFLRTMAAKPQTFCWDVVLAFDRNKTNYILLQDYISRFGADSLFPPFNSQINTDGATHRLIDLQLDKPRLSFDNAVITQSRARCLMRTVSGLIIETTQPQGYTRQDVKRLGIADGLVGPVLEMVILLDSAEGSVGSLGKVELDLVGQGSNSFKLSGVDTAYEADKLGTHLSDEIKKWKPEQKRFQLSELRQDSADALKPKKFFVLTRPMPGSTLRAADDFGDGEVLVLIAVEGGETGAGLPPENESIPYLLPKEYSSNLVISHDQFIKRMFVPQLMALLGTWGGQYEEKDNGEFKKYVLTHGSLSAPQVTREDRIDGDRWSFHCRTVVMPFAGMTLSIVGNAVKLAWSGESAVMFAHAMKYNMDNPDQGNHEYEGDVAVTWDLVQEFRVTIVQDDIRKLPVLEIQPIAEKLTSGSRLVDVKGHPDCKAYFEKNVMEHFKVSCHPHLVFLQEQFKSLTQRIDAFRLNGLLFRDTSVVVPRDTAVPGDLTILGDIGPKQTAYELSDTEKVVAAGGTHQFTVKNSDLAIDWSVADPLDSDRKRGISPAAVGSIGANGLYTAPTAATIGSSKRVIVTATARDGSWVGKALVHLVESPVSVFPRVNVVNLSLGDKDEGYVVWAGSSDTGTLTWEITGNADGRLVEDNENKVQSARRYHTPAQFPTGGKDFEKVVRIDRVEVSQAGRSAAACEMVLVKNPSANFFFKQTSLAKGIQFSFWAINDDGDEVALPNDENLWGLLSGHGTLDQNGLYTFAEASIEHYVIVGAIHVPSSSINKVWNFTILPLPLATMSNEVARP